MPIDALGQYQTSQDALKNLLAGQPAAIDQNLSATKGRILASRKPAFDALSAYGANIDPSIAPAINASLSQKMPMLDRSTQAILDQQRLAQGQDIQGKTAQMYQANTDTAQENLRTGLQYQRGYARQSQINQYQAEANAKDRQRQIALNNLRAQYSASSINLANSYLPSNDYSSAMLRILAATGVTVGTMGAIKALNSKTQTDPNTDAVGNI